MSERLEIQLRYKVNAKKFRTKKQVEVAVQRARAHFLRTGKEIAGVKIIGMWSNPDRINPHRAMWKSTEDPDQSLQQFYDTLRGPLSNMATEQDPVEIKEPPKRKRRPKKFNRKKAMLKYHNAIRKIQWENGGISYAEARRRYKK